MLKVPILFSLYTVSYRMLKIQHIIHRLKITYKVISYIIS